MARKNKGVEVQGASAVGRRGFASCLGKLAGALLIGIEALVANPVAAESDLVRDGKPMAAIVISATAPAMVRWAASELQTYVEKASGAKLPIETNKPTDGRACVFVGESAWTKELGLSTDDLGPDGFRIVARDNWLALIGREREPIYGTTTWLRRMRSCHESSGLSRFGETGALFATYKYLEEQCGIRWYMPGALGEVVPKLTTIPLGHWDYRKTPDFEYRFLLNADFHADGDAAFWYRRVGFGGPFAVSINHSFHRFNKYKDSHPEYYALIDGQRDFNITCHPPGNFCLSTPGVLNQFVADIRALIVTNPQERIFPVMPNDGLTRICECPQCQAQVDLSMGKEGKYSDYMWHFVNEVAKEIRRSNPDKIIGCSAYASYRLPPKKIATLSPNVAVMICASPRFGPATPEYKELVRTWGQKTALIYRWEYYNWCVYNLFLRGIPVFFPHRIAEDMKFLKGISRGEFIQAETWRARSDDKKKMYYPGLMHLNLYITGKMLWDADLDVDRLLGEYYVKFYGPARAPMQSFWTLAEALWTNNVPERQVKLFETVYTEDKIDRLLACLNEAVARTAEGSCERRRVELILSELAPVKERVKNARVMTRVQVAVPHVPSPPVIDGVLDDACWARAVKIGFIGRLGEKADYRTDGWLAWDEENLYLGFVNEEPNTAGMQCLATVRDEVIKPYIWDDDAMEIFINTQPVSDKVYYQFIVNGAGTLWDGQKGTDVYGMNSQRWDSHYEAKVKVGKKQWVLEMRIPFKDLGVSLPKGKTLSANFFRDRSAGTGNAMQYSCWSPTLVHNHHRPDRFGLITFEDPQ